MAIKSLLFHGPLFLLATSVLIRGSESFESPHWRWPATTHITVDGQTAKFCGRVQRVCYRKELQCDTIQKPTSRGGCYCDPSCVAFGDCCYDYQDIQGKCSSNAMWRALATVLPEVRQRSEYLSCSGTHFQKPIYSVSRCPLGADPSMEQQCHKDPTGDIFESRDIYTTVPVTVRGIPFNNVYCAQCHKLPLSNVNYWPVNFACGKTFNESGPFTPEVAIFISLHAEEISGCNTTVVESKDNAALYRNCDSLKGTDTNKLPPVAECFNREQLGLPESVYNDIVRNCSTYDANVFSIIPVTKGTNYKNMFCAFCQNSTLDDLYCEPVVAIEPDGKIPIRVSGSLSPFLSSTVIIPGGFRSLLELPEQTTDKKCGNGTVFDPILGSCRSPIRCNIGYVEWNNSCILDPFLPVYGTPLVDYENHITMWMNTTLKESISVICSDGDLQEADFPFRALATAVEKNVQQIIGVDRNDWLESRTFVYNKNLIQSMDLVGGRKVTFLPGIVVETSVVVPSKIMNQKAMGEAIERNYPRGLKLEIRRYSILNRGVKDGVLKCSSGNLLNISLAAGTGVSDYYVKGKEEDPATVATKKDSVTLSTGEYVTAVKEYTVRRTRSVDNQVVVCDEYSQLFQGCIAGVLEYDMSNFTIQGHSVISKDSDLSIQRSNVVIAGDKIYLCPGELEQSSSLAEVVITYVGMILSIIFLVYLLVTYGVFPQLRTLPGKLLMHLSGCLIVAQLLFMFGHTAFTIPVLCSLLGMIQHYAFLATFCWMNAIAINTVRTFTSPFGRTSSPVESYRVLCFVTYGLPFLVCVTGAILEFGTAVGPLYGSRSCWMVHRIYMIATFVVPVSAIIAANLVIFIIAVVAINTTTRATKSTIGKKNRAEFFIYSRLAFLMGLTWIFGFIAIFAGNDVIWYIFTILNTSQGLFIGLSFGCNERVRRLYREKLETTRGGFSTSSSSNKSSTKMVSLGTSTS